MSRTYHHGKRNSDQRLRIRAVRREKPDMKRLSHALIALAEAELEREAQVEHRKKNKKAKP